MTEQNGSSSGKGSNRNLVLGILGGVAAVIFFCIVAVLITENGVVNDGNKKQQELITRYNDTSNVLSDCIVKTKAAVGVTGAQTDALDKVISDAVRGRYEEPSSAKPGTGGALFSAISEAYPNLDGLSRSFENAQITINGCRTDFRNSQGELQRAVERFNQWREGSWTVRTFGGGDYPTDKLVIEVEGKSVTGEEALTKMRQLVLVKEAREGRDTGEIEAENPFENQPAS